MNFNAKVENDVWPLADDESAKPSRRVKRIENLTPVKEKTLNINAEGFWERFHVKIEWS